MPSRLTAVDSRAPCLGADQKARGLWERDCAGNELKMCASLAEIFVLRYEGKYTLGVSSGVMR